LFALQFCWVSDARETVISALRTRDADVRKVALTVLRQKLKREELAACVRKLAGDTDPGLAASVFWLVTQIAPDASLARKLLAHREHWGNLRQALPRYHACFLSPATRAMAAGGRLQDRRAALVALIHQNDNSGAARALVSRYLIHPAASLREMAAEYLSWHGGNEDLAALRAACVGETDAYARASIQAAMKAIDRRGSSLPEMKAPRPFQKAPSPDWDALASCYRRARELLRAERSSENLKKAWSAYAMAESHEPWWCYGTCRLEKRFRMRCVERLALQALLLRIPHAPLDNNDAFTGDNRAPVASAFMPPVRHYLDPKRKSYGFFVSDEGETFANSVHVGDDVGWRLPHGTIVAMGDGIVRSVLCTHSWGYKVVIEHKLSDGSHACSLYAHLSPFVHVKPGQVVRKGTKIGSIGRSNTWENGGYGAHLHFGIHSGSYIARARVGDRILLRTDRGRAWAKVTRANDRTASARIEGTETERTIEYDADWICGYIDPADFKAGRHGWIDPQRFLRERSGNQKRTVVRAP
jgi:hypothetical protein